ncbi:MAG: peptidase domain-containing ABC transporter, partial [Muribaculaceae bacterium]|nr:peptidase domain-containing ABC transporter [Muribaculaceae bacterium]
LRSWIMLHVNARIDIALISDFLIKLMRLPLRFFDTKMTGDLMQRIGDHGRIKSLLMNNSMSIIFSAFNFVIFSAILGYYYLPILLIFLGGNTLYVLWILGFMKYRRELDIRRFNLSAGEQSSVIQLIQGMQEIKLNNSEKQKRWEWESIQVKLFKVGLRGLAIGQIQQVGSAFFTQSTNILITFIAAKAVIDGQMTLGMMMSMTYIIGQLSAPVGDLIGLTTAIQDAKISLERLNEIHQRPDEEQDIETKRLDIPVGKPIEISDVKFSYSGAERDYALDGVTLTIPPNRVTAIVGASGSGKTTIIKLLQGFYEPMHGSIKIGSTPLSMLNPHKWREVTGSVMQEGFIFSDTIARNIAVGTDDIDPERLARAVQVANIEDFILSLPMGYSTKIGMEGNGISSGQKQRILIARAVYKNPEFIFFDEATNSLDANNESIIMQNLKEFYRGKTVVIVAHRLSTVVDADKIIVMDHGKVVEEGTHGELLTLGGKYYTLVKNQIELGLS